MRRGGAGNVIRSYYRPFSLLLLSAILFSSPMYAARARNRSQSGPAALVKRESDYTLKLTGRKFAQGEVILLQLTPDPTSKFEWNRRTVRWNKTEYLLSKVGDHYVAFLPVPPEIRSGPHPLEIPAPAGETGPEPRRYEIIIQKTRFLVRNITLKVPPQYTTKELPKETLDFIKECDAIKKKAFQSESPLMIEGDFVSPVKERRITSPFYSRRNYVNKKGKPHGGADFQGDAGDPIYAAQSGRVLIARPMYYEGILTVIDHGARVFSLYMHQSATLVKEGDYVAKGALIGKIGSTGMSTAPHLHFAVRVQNTLIDPLSALSLRIR